MKVKWDDDIPNMMGKIIKMFQTTNQNILPTATSHFGCFSGKATWKICSWIGDRHLCLGG